MGLLDGFAGLYALLALDAESVISKALEVCLNGRLDEGGDDGRFHKNGEQACDIIIDGHSESGSVAKLWFEQNTTDMIQSGDRVPANGKLVALVGKRICVAGTPGETDGIPSEAPVGVDWIFGISGYGLEGFGPFWHLG